MITKEKRKELWGIFLYFILVAIIIIVTRIGYLPAVMLYFGLPSIYITIKKRNALRKTLIYSILISIPMVLIFNYIMTINNVWEEAGTIGIRIMNTFPIDTFLWVIFYTYFIIIFYEYFFDQDKIKRHIYKKQNKLIILLGLLLFIFGVIYFTNRDFLLIRYFYLLFVIGFFIIPLILILIRYPHLVKKITLQGVYFFVLSLIYEFSAVLARHWEFKGTDYIGMIKILSVSFPLEELVWLMLFVPAFIGVYEYFADDLK